MTFNLIMSWDLIPLILHKNIKVTSILP